MAQEGTFWELVPENVIEKPAERNSTDIMRQEKQNGKGIEKTVDRD